jgi:hypothetical protein
LEAKGFSKRAQMLMSQKAANERLHARTPSHQAVTVQVEGRTFPAYLRDISDNGAFLFTSANATEGMQITLEMAKPGASEKTIIRSEVVRVEPSPYAELKGVALKFGERKLAVGTA